MDSLLKAIHSHHEYPEAEFVPLVDGSMHTYMRARADFTYLDSTESSHFTSYQPMTPLGKMSAFMSGRSCQVPLLVNMLRYVMLRRVCAASPGQEEDLSSSLGMLTENAVDVCLDYPFGEDYPETNRWDWPCCDQAAAIPRYTHMRGMPLNPPTIDVYHYIDCIDLYNQSSEGVAFVLLMLAGWTRRSRYRLDFDLGKLTNHVYYKSVCELTGAASWSDTTADAKRTPLPKLPSWRVAWEATQRYIKENSLYSQFSTALYLVSAAMYQFRPVTIEATSWLAVEWNMSLPGFSSPRRSRDGYAIVPEGDGDGMLSDRAVLEWNYFSRALERINLLALTFSQAYHTGLGVRSCRLGLEVESESSDIFLNKYELYVKSSFISFAAAEALKMPVPSSGMSNAYLYCEVDFEDYDDGRVVVADVPSDDTVLSPAYKWAVGDHAPVNSRRVVEDAERLKEDEESFVKDEESVVEDEEKEEALLDSTRRAVLWTATTRCKAITVPRFVLPGLPNLLLPLDAFPQPTPWNMTGAICRTEQGKIRTKGWEVSAYEAWAIANVVHTFKSILVLRDNTEFTTKAGYYTPAATNFTFPLLRLQDQQFMPVILQNLEKTPGTTTVLPELTSPYFQGRLTYTTHIMSRGVSSTTTSPAKIIRG